MSEAITLLEFNRRVARLVQNVDVQRCWVVAETSDVRVSGGHCYMELVQKNPDTGQTVAKAHGIIWQNVFARLKFAFENATNQTFGNGLNVMVEVTASVSERFGYSLIITNINPTYTLGDMARLRLEILNRLKAEGVIDMNKMLSWPDVPRCIAVISAAGAAGYGDFMNQLHCNSMGVKYYTCLFPAVMQGQNTVPSVIAALDRIAAHEDLFDCVVIIRGGGSTSDLNSFDNYDLASVVAQFPLPVISGIGHDRDNTVIDSVAAVRVKTPTAAAEWLLQQAKEAVERLSSLTDAIVDTASQLTAAARQQLAYFAGSVPLLAENIMTRSRTRLQQLAKEVPMTAENIMVRSRSHLQQLAAEIPMSARSRIEAERRGLVYESERISRAAKRKLEYEQQRMKSLEKQAELLSPRQVLKRGYTLTMHNGRFVTSSDALRSGDVITSHFGDGSKKISIVK